ncbi:efflux RND transporter periplasmic adaptor subunit [uncultured Jannaschia sp.]|uniref:efflux RND transporter periplasmic adaptor subunit n=1 Tax=uncultured Jannaschia sp. TaxID=293347 RepID=UPI00260B3789|nr:efflux RND transporter periplasmic adaptor subunit [uncultured Jannaschia sp.]
MDETPKAPPANREPLAFETDRGASRSNWIAGGVLLAVVAWMGSGFVLPSAPPAVPERATEREPASVVARMSQAAPVTLTFQAEGQAEPDRDTPLRASATGDVAEVLVRKGDVVEAGQPVVRLSSTRAEADLATAEELLTRARRDSDNAEQLLERGVGTADRVAEARAALASAEAQVVTAEQELSDLDILAPFAGRIEALSLSRGEFVSAGEQIGRIVDNRPLTVAIQVPQQALNRIEDGMTAEVTFITGETREGRVTFVSTSAAAETRTFLAEIEVANSDGAIPAGVSAEVVIPTGEAMAHFVTPSVVSLNPEGDLGVKTVEDGLVRFHPIEIVRAELAGVWATGVPERAEIITIGQGFVQEGEPVRVQPAEAAETADVVANAGEAGE